MMKTAIFVTLVLAVLGQNEDDQTACQRARHNAALDNAPELPQCMEDGTFEAVQCSDMTGLCWCVDVETGKYLEIELSECQMPVEGATDDSEEGSDDSEEGSDDSEEGSDDSEEGSDDSEEGSDDSEEGSDDSEEGSDDDNEPKTYGEDQYCLWLLDTLEAQDEDVEFLPECNDDGTFVARQCNDDGEACFCAERLTGAISTDLTACPEVEDDEDDEDDESTDGSDEVADDSDEVADDNEALIDDADIASDDEDEDEEETTSMGPEYAGAAVLGVAMVGIASLVVSKRRSTQAPDVFAEAEYAAADEANIAA